VALDKSEVSAKGKLLLGGALESALEIELRGKYHNYIEHREKTSFPRGRIEIGKDHNSGTSHGGFGIKWKH
jgi:5-methylcytosine-specific restriction endonuclease McrBC regulatory subunit McrC